MYILVVSRGYPSKKYPLNGIFEFDQAKALANFGHKIIYLSLDFRSIRRWRKLGKYWIEIDGVKILNLSIPLGRIPKSFMHFIGQIAIRLLYLDIVRKYGKPEIVHAHFSGIGYMASVLKKKMKIPLVITEHGSKLNKPYLKANIKKTALRAYANANILISVSSELKKNILQNFNIESEIIHNIVDINKFKYSVKSKNNVFSFISVGNLIQMKGFNTLIEAFKKVDFDKNVVLKIIGDGPERNKIQKQIDFLGLNDRVKLLGRLTRSEISSVMRDCDVFVLPSRSETFGVVYIEAMLSGLPVIATDCGGPKDFVTPENGLLVPVDDVDTLAKALYFIYNSVDRYNTKKISLICKKKFSPNNIAAELTQVYKKALLI
jgi:glycosyltransferase involved in cell wall biosynthesis